MGKTILVTGKEGYLSSEIAQHFLNQGCRVAVSVSRRAEAPSVVDHERNLMQFSWNRSSAAASKNFLLKIIQRWDTLDEAWVVVSPEREALSLTDLSSAAVDETVDTQVKGLLYLLRELAQRQAALPNLALHVVFYDEEPASLPPLAALHYYGIKAMVSGLMAQARKRSLQLWAYESLVPKLDEYVAYLLTSRVPRPGQWNLLGEKKTSWFGKKEAP